MKTKNFVKTPEALEAIRVGGKKLGEILYTVSKMVRPGITTKELDKSAEEMIRAAGGRPSFLGYSVGPRYPAYTGSLCVSVNDEVVHGIPKDTHVLQEGDIIGLDIGMEWPYTPGGPSGFYTDTAMTVAVGNISEEDATLLKRTQTSLYAGIAAARGGAEIADISRAVQAAIKPFGYGIVEDLVGHGVGYAVHEEPQVPNFYYRGAPHVPLTPGMVLALEPMINRGRSSVYTDRDHWTIKTADKSRSAHFEHTIIITEAGPEVVTKRPEEVI